MKKKKISILDTMAGPFAAMLVNLLMAFAVYFVARVEFLLENYSYFSSDLSLSHLATMFWGGYIFDRSAITYSNILYIVLMLFPLWMKENRLYHLACKWVFVAVNALTFIINLCDSVYFPYTLRRTTTSVFREFSNENNLADVFWGELLVHWYLVLLAAVVIWGMWKLYLMPKTHRSQFATTGQRLKFGLVQLLLLAAITPLAVGACRGGLGTGIRPITINNANQYVHRPTECALVLNTPFSLMRTIGKDIFEVPDYFRSPEEAQAVFDPIHRPKPAHAFRKKNVVVLIVESFGREYIGALNKMYFGGKYRGYTPQVDKLIAKSAVYYYSFCNGRKSIDGMPSILSSIPMFKEPFVLTPASMNTYTGLAGLLAKEGYQTSFFHGANRGSMGFMAFANKTGFQQYYGRQDYAADPRFGGDADFDTHWGIWDEPFLQYWCAKLNEMKQPFMTACFTVSSHTPYVVPDKYKDVFPEEGIAIHKCIRYTDMAIGKFFEAASRQPWFKNTIFVMTSDHTNLSDHKQYQTDIGGFSSPIIIFDPSGEVQPGMRNGIAQQIDIMPTVLSILGYGKPYLSFGCDLMTTPMLDTYAVNYLNGVYQYVKHGYTMQFNGRKVVGMYKLTDLLMQHNLVDKVPLQRQMERELKAIIYQYMYRMVNDRLMPEGKITDKR
ncbi:LTA synthase family protein [Prevotella sp. kh1p2]|uniref:LTA synthase family protein n=1 Tax=Prevotella sp. kh1p2 TaxID=1761883 RepID=UPI0008C55FCF|nr:alkaline phosphatase family protein [Prevotella sp. kh1p2]SES86713.1 Phosphoglycerol transferase MdoB [Prevotella sp. kh1p2]SNU11110.1 Phosphoglycerol transferase MdoB [Prevotellaceae bacterium KH2P17]